MVAKRCRDSRSFSKLERIGARLRSESALNGAEHCNLRVAQARVSVKIRTAEEIEVLIALLVKENALRGGIFQG